MTTMSRQSGPCVWLASATAAAVIASLGLLPLASPGAAAEEPAAAAQPLTITPNPSYKGDAFEGWGTSLVWFANATGGYPESVRQDLFDKVFGEDGLNLNIARYNIGGGNASDVPDDYMRAGAAVEGWWNPDLNASDAQGPITSNYADRERYDAAWTGDQPEDYNFDADATQRWWITALKDRITKWEAFSNSPPYFMTESGYATGGFDSSTDQIKSEDAAKFAKYLKTVTEHIEAETGISFDSIEPLNEPNTGYWGTWFDDSGNLLHGRQEGAHAGPALQDKIIQALADELAKPDTTTGALLAAPDETNPSKFVEDWNGYTDEARDDIDRLNVHTYGTSGRVEVRDIAKTSEKPLWMSEVEGDWDGTGFNQTNINNGIGMAGRIMDDLRELEPSAWIFWQPVEDYYNMQKVENKNWGSVFIDFDCNAEGMSERRLADGDADPSCTVKTNSKYNTVRNFTHYIRPGDFIVPTNDTNTTAAVKSDDSGAVLVHANATNESQAVTVDLSKFDAIAPGATITPIVTTESPADAVTENALVPGTPVSVDTAAKSAVVIVPANSVSTLLVDGVSGVAENASGLQAGKTVQLVGVQSGKALTAEAPDSAGSSPTTIRTLATDESTANAQSWTLTKLTDGDTHKERYRLTNKDGRTLTADSNGTHLLDLSAEAATTNPQAQWYPTTTDGQTYSFVNVAAPLALDVGGEATTDGAAVGTYHSTNGSNQAFSVRSTEVTGARPVTVSTVPGIPATLPSTVVPVYGSVEGAAVPVTWETGSLDWSKSGTVQVQGSATDVFGHPVPDVTATVEIGTFTYTDPTSITTVAGATLGQVQAAAPVAVPAGIGSSTNRFNTDVVWDWSGLNDASFGQPGLVSVTGTAKSNDPNAQPLKATLSVIMTEPQKVNVAPAAETTATATFTESGYSIEGTRNGVATDKAWSNWTPEGRSGDTLSYTFASTEVLSDASLQFYADGSNTSWAKTVEVQYRVPGTETWETANNGVVEVVKPAVGAPFVQVQLGGVSATGVRFVLASAGTYMTVSEAQINVLRPAAASVADAGVIRADGLALAGFEPDTTEYSLSVPGTGSAEPQISAVPTDGDATVSVKQFDGGPTATVTVIAADGAATKIYTITLHRTVAVTIAPLDGKAFVGKKLTATVSTDPEGAKLSFQWLRNGAPIPGATSAIYKTETADAGTNLSVRVVAAADGLEDGEGTSDPVTIESKKKK